MHPRTHDTRQGLTPRRLSLAAATLFVSGAVTAAALAAPPSTIVQGDPAPPPVQAQAPEAAAPAPGLGSLAAAIDTPRVGRAVTLDAPLRTGRATFELAPGGSARLLLAGGEPVGLLLGGPVKLTYVVEDRYSLPVAQRNVKRAASVPSALEDGKLVIREDVASAAVWSWQLAAAAAGTKGGEASDGGENDGGESGGGKSGGEPLPAALAHVLDSLLVTPPSVVMLAERASRHAGPGATYALVHGSHDDLLLSVDPVDARTETLYSLGTLKRVPKTFRGGRVIYELAAQPMGRRWWDRVEAPLTAIDEKISLDNANGDRKVRVTTRSTVRSNRGDTSLWITRLADTLYDEDKALPVRVSKVTVDGEPADYLLRSSTLLVDLGRRLAKDGTAVVEVVHEGDYARRPNNDSYWYLSTWPWYPQPDLNAEYATVDIEMRVPKPFTPFASGDTLERREEDGVNYLHTRLDKPMQFPVVAAGKYHVFKASRNGVDAEVATYVFGQEKAAEVLQSLFFGAAEVYGQMFGVPYPFSEVDILEINQWGWGQAPPGVIFITQEAYNPIGDVTSRFFSEGINDRFAHEVAHAWWGHVIKMDSEEEQWLAESFAEYSAAVAIQAMRGGKRGEKEFASILRNWKVRTDEIGEGGSIYLADHLAGEDDADYRDRTLLLYCKGPLVLHALRQELGRRLGSAEKGDKYFLALLRTFATNFTGQYGQTRHLVGILGQMTGDDWQPWFDRYVYGTETPAVKE